MTDQTDPQGTLVAAIDRLRRAIEELDGAELDGPSNCGGWSVRQLASHALNNQLIWGSMVTGTPTVTLEDTMAGTPIEGDLGPVGVDVAARSAAMWATPDVFGSVHTTPFGGLPGSVIINLPTFDALVHAWDLAVSTGRTCELSPSELAAVMAVAHSPIADGARDAGLVGPPVEAPDGATDTERLMAALGRSVTQPGSEGSTRGTG
jgi:uncharacterized protein (TIGR03086 family)